MMIAPTLLAARRMGAQGEEKAGQQRKGGPTRTPTLGADALTGATRPRMSDARNRRKYERWCGTLLHRRGRGGYGLVLSSYDMNGGSYRKMNEVVKGYFCRA